MIEVRFIRKTGVITAWCGDPKQFGNLDRGREGEVITILDADVPNREIQEVKMYRGRIVEVGTS